MRRQWLHIPPKTLMPEAAEYLCTIREGVFSLNINVWSVELIAFDFLPLSHSRITYVNGRA